MLGTRSNVRSNEAMKPTPVLSAQATRGCRSRRHVGRVAGQVPDENVRVDERVHRRDAARAALVRLITSSHATFRLAAGTVIVPARSKNFGVRARTAR